MRTFDVTYFVDRWDNRTGWYDQEYSVIVGADTVEEMWHNFQRMTGHSPEQVVEVVEVDKRYEPVETIYRDEEWLSNC